MERKTRIAERMSVPGKFLLLTRSDIDVSRESSDPSCPVSRMPHSLLEPELCIQILRIISFSDPGRNDLQLYRTHRRHSTGSALPEQRRCHACSPVQTSFPVPRTHSFRQVFAPSARSHAR